MSLLLITKRGTGKKLVDEDVDTIGQEINLKSFKKKQKNIFFSKKEKKQSSHQQEEHKQSI